ncbi:hypothetical protein CPLU01_09487 [Colletotrichum plurivorum]|uniref:Uncharacterized protein n=1 Tax=Colletotrichum plurivorum TaxID=2175906 RepID=A0A8H6K927_9PEZI|nr:hypothetical protein CPLU01_09487 [Colletotrichum plurivorum]
MATPSGAMSQLQVPEWEKQTSVRSWPSFSPLLAVLGAPLAAADGEEPSENPRPLPGPDITFEPNGLASQNRPGATPDTTQGDASSDLCQHHPLAVSALCLQGPAHATAGWKGSGNQPAHFLLFFISSTLYTYRHRLPASGSEPWALNLGAANRGIGVSPRVTAAGGGSPPASSSSLSPHYFHLSLLFNRTRDRLVASQDKGRTGSGCRATQRARHREAKCHQGNTNNGAKFRPRYPERPYYQVYTKSITSHCDAGGRIAKGRLRACQSSDAAADVAMPRMGIVSPDGSAGRRWEKNKDDENNVSTVNVSDKKEERKGKQDCGSLQVQVQVHPTSALAAAAIRSPPEF